MQIRFPLRAIGAQTAATVAAIVLSCTCASHANHGPGASGGGSFTISGETLKAGHFEFSLREDFTQFQHFSPTAAAQRAEFGGDFDALDRGFLTSTEFAYGITDDFQIGGSIGYYVGHDFIGADKEETGEINVSTADPEGLTDLALIGKYRFLKGQPGNLAIVGGVILPTGRTDVHLRNGELLSPTDQPGTGRFGLPIGLAYSRFLTSHLTIDASVLYTFRLEKDEFKVGDRFDAGVALAYRFNESIKEFPQFSVFVELNDVMLQKDRDHGELDPNSGSNTLYITPGIRVRLDEHSSVTFSPSFPVLEDVNGDQGSVEFKAALVYTLSF